MFGLDGDDTFNHVANAVAVNYEGGDPSASDVLNYTAAANAASQNAIRDTRSNMKARANRLIRGAGRLGGAGSRAQRCTHPCALISAAPRGT